MIKKYLLTIALFVISYVGFSQTTTTPSGTASPTNATPTAQLRIADRITVFGQNLPATINSAYLDLILINRSANYLVESFEATSTPGTYTLSYFPVRGTVGVTVMMNGASLRPGTDYTCLRNVLTIISSQLQYDKFVVSYTYTTN
jgi:hypothetical protein